MRLQNSNVIVTHYFRNRKENESMSDFYRTIRGSDGKYWISRDGQVFSRKKYGEWRQMKLSKNYDGYYEISITWKQRPQAHKQIHSLVAEHFIRPLNKGECVCHYDGNRINNDISNLMIGTPALNMRFRYIDDGSAKVAYQVRKESHKMSNRALARKYNIPESRVSEIINKKTYKWLDDEVIQKKMGII